MVSLGKFWPGAKKGRGVSSPFQLRMLFLDQCIVRTPPCLSQWNCIKLTLFDNQFVESRSQAVVTSPYNYRKILSAAMTQQQENHFVIPPPPPVNDSCSVVQVTTCPNVDGTEEPNILMSTPFLTNGIQKTISGMASFWVFLWVKLNEIFCLLFSG